MAAKEPSANLSPLLREACCLGEENRARELIRAGADVNKFSDGIFDTPLGLASQKGHLDIV